MSKLPEAAERAHWDEVEAQMIGETHVVHAGGQVTIVLPPEAASLLLAVLRHTGDPDGFTRRLTDEPKGTRLIRHIRSRITGGLSSRYEPSILWPVAGWIDLPPNDGMPF